MKQGIGRDLTVSVLGSFIYAGIVGIGGKWQNVVSKTHNDNSKAVIGVSVLTAIMSVGLLLIARAIGRLRSEEDEYDDKVPAAISLSIIGLFLIGLTAPMLFSLFFMDHLIW